MATNATYKYYNGSAWVEYHFKTNAGQVDPTTSKHFITTSTTVNGQAFNLDSSNGAVSSVTITGANIANGVASGTYNVITSGENINASLVALDQAVGSIPSGVLTETNFGTFFDTGYPHLSDIESIGEGTGIGALTKYLDGWGLASYQPSSTELSSIANITSGSGLLKRDGNSSTWSLDTNEYALASSLGTAAAKNYTSSVTQNSADLVTSGAVWAAINDLPEPMVFKGSLGTGGTITTLPTASSSNEGYVYKVITAGTYAGQAAKVGDTFICAKTGTSTYEWVLIPSGDEPSGTVTSVGLRNGSTSQGTLTISGSPITSSGTIDITLASAYGDTVNPYGSKTKNYVLAAPNGSNGVPTFRALVKADLPTLTLDDVGDGSTRKLSNYVPYTGATSNVDLGSRNLTLNQLGFTNGGTITVDVNGNISGMLGSSSQTGDWGIRYNNDGYLASENWVNAQGFSKLKITASNTQPSSPNTGDIWIQTAA